MDTKLSIQKQFTVFLINKPGKLAHVCAELAHRKVNIVALTVMDTTDHGLLRMVVEQPDEARTVLTGLNVEITETDAERAQGLMFRTHMPPKTGMLFFYPTPREITMWMRNTYVPLDMVFIRKDGTVHRIEARTEPLSETIISSQGDTVACLELAGGEAARLGLAPGDKIQHRLFR